MKMKKLLTLLFAFIMVSLSATTAFAAKKDNDNQAHFKPFTGLVKEIKESATAHDTTYVLLENKDGGEATFILTEDTYFINDEEIRIGSEVTGYFDANAMMIMIYPPQYEAVAIMVSNRKQNIKVDHFDANLISADNSLKLKISKNTQVVLKDGTTFKGDLTNRKLAVFYGTSTRSIPAQTTPDKVVILSDPLVPDVDDGSYYDFFTGRVTKLTLLGKNKDKTQITLKDEDDREAIFTISKDTYRTNDETITVGSEVTGYYDAKMFRIMIYPAQYHAEVVAVERTEHNVKVDYFDSKLTSADGTLRIKLGKDTELINRDGTNYHGKPIKSNLVVIYDIATKSIPAQTEPIKVIVLEDSKDKDSKEDDKDKEDKKDKSHWEKKRKEWKELTKELLEHMDEIFDDRYEFYDDIRQILGHRIRYRK